METRGAPRRGRGLLLRLANVLIVLLVISVLVLGVYEAYAGWADPKASAVNYAVNWLSQTTGRGVAVSVTPTPEAE
jgi:hypothetical protein